MRRKASLVMAMLFVLFLAGWSWAASPPPSSVPTETPPGNALPPSPGAASPAASQLPPSPAGGQQQGEGTPTTVETPKVSGTPSADGTPPDNAPPAATVRRGQQQLGQPTSGRTPGGTGITRSQGPRTDGQPNFIEVRRADGSIVRWDRRNGPPPADGFGKGPDVSGPPVIHRHQTVVNKTVQVTQRIWIRVAPTAGEVRVLRDLLLRRELSEKKLDPVGNQRDREMAIYYEALANLRYGHLSPPEKTEVVKANPDGTFSWPSGGLTFHLDDGQFGEPDWKKVEARVAEARAEEIRKSRKLIARTQRKADEAFHKAGKAGTAAAKAHNRANAAHDRLDREIPRLVVGILLIGLNILVVLGFAAALAHQHALQQEENME